MFLNVFHHEGINVRQLQLKLQNEGTINGLKNVVHNQESLGADATDAAKILNIFQINGQWLSKTQSLAINNYFTFSIFL